MDADTATAVDRAADRAARAVVRAIETFADRRAKKPRH
jgi:hypothetical protein